MSEIYSVKPFFAVFISLIIVPVLISSRSPNIREGWTFAAASVKFLIIASMLPMVLAGKKLVFTMAKVLPGISLKFSVDAFGLLFALAASILWIITSAYSIGYMRGLSEHSQTRYYSFFAVSLSAAIGAAFSANLLTLYLFYEMLSLATYPLVTHHQDEEAKRAGRKYLLYIMGTSIGFVLPAMILTYHSSGSLEFTARGLMNTQQSATLTTLVLLMFVFGFAKAGMMPFHSWLPAAMVAPTPVSALLHAVAVVKVGVFSILRILTGIFGVGVLGHYHLDTVVAWIAAFTIITASAIAMSQDGLKRRLAFSTISQLSYIVLGAALLSKSGIAGGMLHIAMHAFGKITLFFCAGAIFVGTGVKNISRMPGIGKRMPLTMIAFFVGALSVIGLPPCGGFISKWYLVMGTLEANRLWMLGVLLTSSFLNAVYFLPIVYKAFFCTAEESMFTGGIDEAPIWCVAPLVITAAISIFLFFYPQPFLNLAEQAATCLVGG